MRKRSSILIFALALLCLFLAGLMHGPLIQERRDRHLNQADPLENSPPLVAFTTVALGGFRGIIADILWIRASRLQTEGKYFELVQLSDWITKLEPRFAAVWSYHAWNMSYNVSVMFSDPSDRWRWVRHGISLVRDQGLSYNPGNADLYRELGWHFQHKIGADYDSAHTYYKRAWREEMERILPGGYVDFESLNALPDQSEQILKDPGVKALASALEASGTDPFSSRLLDHEARTEREQALLNEHAGADLLLAFIRRRTMIDSYKMIPETMQELETEFGRMDWRLPQTHAAYWAYRGLEHAEGFASVSLHRMIFQSLADAYLSGTRVYDPLDGTELTQPNPAHFPAADRAFDRAVRNHPEEQTMLRAQKNFTARAILELFMAGEEDTARAVLEKRQDLLSSTDLEEVLFNAAVVTREDIQFEDVAYYLMEITKQIERWQRMGNTIRAGQCRRLSEILQRQAAQRGLVPENSMMLESFRSHLQGGPRFTPPMLPPEPDQPDPPAPFIAPPQ